MSGSRLLSFVLVCTSASAADWYIPTVVSPADSDDPKTQTSVRIYNPNSSAADVDVYQIGVIGGPAPAPKRFTIGPGQALGVDDLLGQAFGGSAQSGAVRLRAGQGLVVSGWAANSASAGGITRTELPVVSQRDVLQEGDSSYGLWVSSPGGAAASEAVSAGVVLLGAASQVDVLAFDSTGKELGRKTFSGTEQWAEAALSSFAPAGSAVARMNFLVRSGRAIGYVKLKNALGVSEVRVARVSLNGPVKWFVGGGRKLTADNGQAEQTDLRLLNLAFADAKVTITAWGDAALGWAPATMTVGARRTLDIRDVFGSVFGADQASSAGLTIESDSPVLVAARQFQADSQGNMGAFGEALPASLAEDVPGAGQVLRVFGVQNADGGPNTGLLFQSGADGVSGSINVLDISGNVVAHVDGPVAGPNQPIELGPEDLLRLGQWPDEAIVELRIASGSALFASRQTTPQGAAPFLAVSRPEDPYDCPLPVISSFGAQPQNMTAAGSVDLFWDTDGDTVQLLPAGTKVAATDGTTLNVSATTTYTLQAGNACGVARQALTVWVGAPKTTSVSPLSAPPGSLITIQVSGVDDPSTITGVNFTFAGQVQSVGSVEEALDGGDIQVRVPFVISSASALGYVTGPGTIQVNLGTGASLEKLPFTILPLPSSGDAITEFRSLIDFFDTTGRSVLNDTAAAASIPLPSPAEPVLDEALAVLRKVASDIDTSGTAQIPAPPLSSGITYTVTRQDLQMLLALMHSVNGNAPLIGAALTSGKEAWRKIDAKQRPCIEDEDKLYAGCLATSFIPTDNIVKQIQGYLSNAGEVVEKLSPLHFIGDWIDRASMATKLTCYLTPLVIDTLQMSPSDEVPINRKVERFITASYKPYWNKNKIVDDQMPLIERRYTELKNAIIARGTKAADAEKWYQSKIAQERAILQDFANAVQKAAAASPLNAVTQRRLGRCELSEVQPTAKSSKILRRQPKDEQDSRTYVFKGGSPGGEATVNAWQDYSEVIVYDRKDFRPARSTNGPPTSFKVQVGKPSRSVSVSSVTSMRQPNTTNSDPRGGFSVKAGQSNSRTAVIDANRCNLKATGISPTDFRIQMDVTRDDGQTPGHPICDFKIEFSREQAFDNSQDVIMTTSITGQAATYPSSSTKITFAGSTNGSPGSQTFDLQVGSGASINSSQNPMTSKGASKGTINAHVDSLGYGPSVHIKTRLQFPDNWEEK